MLELDSGSAMRPRLRTENPPPNRLAPIQLRPRRMGILGAPTSSSAHGSTPPRGTGDGAPTTRCVGWIHSRQDRCAASQSLQFGFLCPAKKRTAQKLNQVPRMPVRVLVSPAGGGGHAPRVAGGGLCGPRGRAAVLWMDKSRHTGLPLLRPPCARQTSGPTSRRPPPASFVRSVLRCERFSFI